MKVRKFGFYITPKLHQQNCVPYIKISTALFEVRLILIEIWKQVVFWEVSELNEFL